MKGRLVFRNRQQLYSIDLRRLRRITRALLCDLVARTHFELCVHLVAVPEMIRLNREFLGHEGSTDVITFNHSEPSQREFLYGEIFICLEDARAQARQFHTTWQSELVRYLLHGVLHLLGYHDSKIAERRKMKQKENSLLRELARRFPLRKLKRAPRVSHWTIRLVSVNGRVRKIRPVVRSSIKWLIAEFESRRIL
jgi:probable rRNA maturation factor